MSTNREATRVEGIGTISLRLRPTEDELQEAGRSKRARGFFLSLAQTLLIEPRYVREDWVRLPEHELRKVALLIAEANDLLPFFRPKKEKPFYGAFRDAWRTKISSHDDAVFQRALVKWKEHTLAALVCARMTYGQTAHPTSEVVRGLAGAGFVLSPTALAKTTSMTFPSSEKEIEDHLTRMWANEQLVLMVDRWFDLEPFRRRERIIRSAFAAFSHGDFPLAIYGLFPQPEGVLWDYLNHFNPAEANLEELIGSQNRTFVTVEAFIRQILLEVVSIKEVPFYKFVKFVDVQDDGTLNRHAVEHGVLVEFGTRPNALRLLLFLDFIRFILGRLLEHSDSSPG